MTCWFSLDVVIRDSKLRFKDEFHLHQPGRGWAKLVVRFRVDDFPSSVYFLHYF